ncbi:hypothetical protein SO802_031175 [Lithocarpus litseifolius]|uniref:CCHC-type domain-containing protein n=1 Tax=Lithocarpus litseifolius TaxID=425828 RepID=A0AAW2BN42_9ROSI
MEVELSTPTQRSSEEEDELRHNVKEFKESNGARSFSQPRKLVSYKDSLVGDIPRAYEQAFIKIGRTNMSQTLNWSLCWKAKMDYVNLCSKGDRECDEPVLRIDSFTASETRGGYARFCVQINMDKPLITSIRIGRLVQRVMYEGVSSLCFSCGQLGHKKESCYYQVKQATTENEKQTAPRTNETREEVQSDSNYGPWMIVTRKKTVSRMGRTNGQSKSNQTSHINTKGNLNLSEHYLEETGKDLEKSHHSDSTQLISETTRITAAQNPQKDLEMKIE